MDNEKQELQNQLQEYKLMYNRVHGQLLDCKLELKDTREENISLKGQVERLTHRVHDLEKSTLEKTAPSKEKVDTEHWKGKDQPIFSRLGDNWTMVTHRKEDKETGEVKESVTTIPHLKVVQLYDMLINLSAELRKIDPVKYKNDPVKIKSRTVWATLIEMYNLDVEIDSFNGGRNRSKFYFPLFYNPLKVLEHLERVEYSARGLITVKSELLYV